RNAHGRVEPLGHLPGRAHVLHDLLVTFARLVPGDDAGAHIAHHPCFFFQRQAQMRLDGVYLALDGRQKLSFTVVRVFRHVPFPPSAQIAPRSHRIASTAKDTLPGLRAPPGWPRTFFSAPHGRCPSAANGTRSDHRLPAGTEWGT